MLERKSKKQQGNLMWQHYIAPSSYSGCGGNYFIIQNYTNLRPELKKKN
jgi:hypothetical protein